MGATSLFETRSLAQSTAFASAPREYSTKRASVLMTVLKDCTSVVFVTAPMLLPSRLSLGPLLKSVVEVSCVWRGKVSICASNHHHSDSRNAATEALRLDFSGLHERKWISSSAHLDSFDLSSPPSQDEVSDLIQTVSSPDEDSTLSLAHLESRSAAKAESYCLVGIGAELSLDRLWSSRVSIYLHSATAKINSPRLQYPS